ASCRGQARPDSSSWRTSARGALFQPRCLAGAFEPGWGQAGRFRQCVGVRRAPGAPRTGGCLEAAVRGRASGGGGLHSALELGRRAAAGASRHRDGWVCVDGAPGRRVAAAPENRGRGPEFRRGLISLPLPQRVVSRGSCSEYPEGWEDSVLAWKLTSNPKLEKEPCRSSRVAKREHFEASRPARWTQHRWLVWGTSPSSPRALAMRSLR